MSDNERKYEFTEKTKEINGYTLHQIRAIEDFGDVKAGDLGGWIEKKSNLSHEGNCWVCGNAMISGNARVCGNAMISGNARVCGDARVSGNSHIGKDAVISSDGDFIVFSNVGSRYDTTTFYKTESGCSVSCGCFNGTIDEFEAAVKETHGDNKYGKEYGALINVARTHFDICETINPQLKTFGYVDEDNYGIECGVVIADSIEEAIQFIKHSDRSEEKRVFEINSKEKGYTYLGSYDK